MIPIDVAVPAGRDLARRLAADLPAGCALAEAGVEPVFAHEGLAVARMVVEERHLNQVGVVQGGVYATLADATAGFATMSALSEDKTFTTLEMRVNLLRGARHGDLLVAEARPVHIGGTTMVVEVRVLRDGDQQRRPCAFFTCTQLLMDRQ
jgi:uncharacterized protein (TIGR00369 family)